MNIEQEGQRLGRRLEELAAWRDRERVPLADIWFQAQDMQAPQSIEIGQLWPSLDSPVSMEFTANIPERWAGQPVLVRLSVGGEGLLSIEGKPIGGLSPFHWEHLLLSSQMETRSVLPILSLSPGWGTCA